MAVMERLNKLLAHAGVGSRRRCDALIRSGRVAVDGRPVHDLGTKIDPDAHQLTVDGHPVGLERPVYWLVNKPRGVVCTNHDPAGRTRAIDRMPAKLGHTRLTLKREAIGPVQLGRLPEGKARRLAGPEREALKLAVARRETRGEPTP